MKSIFVSSTYEDLKEERKAAIDVLDRDHHAVAMEKFFSDDHKAKDVCLRKLQNCDALVLILGSRYGTVDPEEQVSVTEIEYRTAKALGLPRFVFLQARSDGTWRSEESDPDRLSKHLAFKKALDQERHPGLGRVKLGQDFTGHHTGNMHLPRLSRSKHQGSHRMAQRRGL